MSHNNEQQMLNGKIFLAGANRSIRNRNGKFVVIASTHMDETTESGKNVRGLRK